MIKMRSKSIVAYAVEFRLSEWSFEGAMEKHGASGMIHAANVILSESPPKDGCQEWLARIYAENKDNPVQRYAIAAAMLHTAIDCKLYEVGWRSMKCDELIK